LFQPPIARCQATALPLSSRVEGTLIIEHLDHLNLASQRRLLEWIDADTNRSASDHDGVLPVVSRR
jgi:hypothetical protein